MTKRSATHHAADHSSGCNDFGNSHNKIRNSYTYEPCFVIDTAFYPG